MQMIGRDADVAYTALHQVPGSRHASLFLGRPCGETRGLLRDHTGLEQGASSRIELSVLELRNLCMYTCKVLHGP